MNIAMQSSNQVEPDGRAVLFFDVDDCLYPRSLGVGKMMYDLLEKFVMENLSLSKEEAYKLNQKYFEEHTLSVIGLIKRHQVDPLVFNDQNDNALPMDELLSPDKELRAMLEKYDRSKVKLWLFTNAHVTHGLRVVKLLGVDDLFEGITYCDYANGVWPLKPYPEMFEKAERDSGASGSDRCFFVDDSARNCTAALARGWHVVRIVDPSVPHPDVSAKPSCPEITKLGQLHDIFPQFLK